MDLPSERRTHSPEKCCNRLQRLEHRPMSDWSSRFGAARTHLAAATRMEGNGFQNGTSTWAPRAV
eukprot:6241007-Pyramimonas_sp.AAC.1